MSDSISGFVVILDKDIHEDAAERIVNAIQCLRGVISVVPHIANQLDISIAKSRTVHELSTKLWKVLHE